MRIKSFLFIGVLIFLIIVLLESCSLKWEGYYRDEMVSEIKKIKKDKNMIYLEHKFSDRKKSIEELIKYMNEPQRFKFKKSNFENNEVTFALSGNSTTNFGWLNRIENQELIVLDSAACRYGDFLFLKLKPIQKGEYKIKATGCRYTGEFEIKID